MLEYQIQGGFKVAWPSSSPSWASLHVERETHCMETRVKHETADRYEYVMYNYALQSVLKLCTLNIEEVDNMGLLLQHTLPEQNTYGNGYVCRNVLERYNYIKRKY